LLETKAVFKWRIEFGHARECDCQRERRFGG